MANQKLGDFINGLAIKAGLMIDSPELKAFLADPACLVEIDAKISDAINMGLMNEAAALNNKKIVDTLVPKGRSEAYDNIEAKFKPLLDLLDDTDKTALSAMKFTTDKISGLEGVIKNLKEAKKDTKSGPEKDALQKQLDDTLQLLRTEKQARTEFETGLKNQYENDVIDLNLKSSLFGRNWLLPTDTEANRQFAVETAAMKVKADLASKGYKLVRENGNLTLKTSDGTNVYDANHTEVKLNTFVDGAVSALIAPTKTDPNAGKLPGGGGTGGGNNNGKQNFDSAKAELANVAAGMV